MSPPLKPIEDRFSEVHISRTWEELHQRFGFDLKSWKKRFSDFQAKQPRGINITGAFYKFGNDRINPLLNDILGRASGFPTFNRLIEYVIKKN